MSKKNERDGKIGGGGCSAADSDPTRDLEILKSSPCAELLYFYSRQFNPYSCSAASAAIVINSMRARLNGLRAVVPVKPVDLLSAIRVANWKERVSIGGFHGSHGLTVPQLSERVTKAFTRFFVEPKVVINVAQFRPLRISVLGMVGKPGTYPLTEPMRLVPAIALAGGLDQQRASLSNVLVLRANGERQTINLAEVFEGKVDDNVMLYDGDTVRVEEVFGPDWYRVLPPLASSLSILSTIIILLTRN